MVDHPFSTIYKSQSKIFSGTSAYKNKSSCGGVTKDVFNCLVDYFHFGPISTNQLWVTPGCDWFGYKMISGHNLNVPQILTHWLTISSDRLLA